MYREIAASKHNHYSYKHFGHISTRVNLLSNFLIRLSIWRQWLVTCQWGKRVSFLEYLRLWIFIDSILTWFSWDDITPEAERNSNVGKSHEAEREEKQGHNEHNLKGSLTCVGPAGLAGHEQVSVGIVRWQVQHHQFWHHNGQWSHPDHEDHQSCAGVGALEGQWVADGVISLNRDDSQREDWYRHWHRLEGLKTVKHQI